MISKDPNDSGPAAITIRSWTCLFVRAIFPFFGGVWLAGEAWGHVPVIAYCTVAALGGILLLYRTCRHGVRFDDRGITVRNFYWTHKLSWHDVSRFSDGEVRPIGVGESHFWAVEIVLNNGRSVTAEGTMRGEGIQCSQGAGDDRASRRPLADPGVNGAHIVTLGGTWVHAGVSIHPPLTPGAASEKG